MRAWPILLTIAALAALAGCDGTDTAATPTATPTATPGWNGAVITSTPVAKPDITLTDQDGKPYPLRSSTHGKLTLLYYGYTHCPDACPAAMATLTLALRRIPAADRSAVTVVFVTTDPHRDTPAVLKQWLAGFDSSYIGLTGSDADIIQAQIAAHLPGGTASAATPAADGSYAVDHAAAVVAFSPFDDLGHIVYPGGVSADAEAADFTQLIEHAWHS